MEGISRHGHGGDTIGVLRVRTPISDHLPGADPGESPITVCSISVSAASESSAGRFRTVRLAGSGGLGQFHGVLDECGSGIEVEFGLKLLAVMLDGFDAEMQFLRNLAGRMPLAEQMEHLAF